MVRRWAKSVDTTMHLISWTMRCLNLYTIVPKMLWMLGVAAIIVDIVSRFSGGEKSGHSDVPHVVVHKSKPPPVISAALPPTPISAPTIDVTYIVLTEKKERTPLNPMDNNDVSPVPENSGEESVKKAGGDKLGGHSNPEDDLPNKMEPSDIEIEKPTNPKVTGNDDVQEIGVHRMGRK
ncbi:uncharacterized protein LOC110860678 isoform X2 [Folsomia candida]|uniref:uncharacterized protein LOC110860678 isoform X2 n=1 Tax=Folsomia candida TaxID=158441 RepID=UPI000B904C79|nr:uncharacterized protein LOC110860678 isoform X2 [Folsomia candida]